MKKRYGLLCMLLLTALLLSGCQNGNQPAPTAAPSAQAQKPPMELEQPQAEMPDFSSALPENYDPSSEEEAHGDLPFDTSGNLGAGQPGSVYAGATPIPLDPIDMPTPTPKKALAFTYAAYTATKLGLSFESVAGYDVDESAGDSFVLTEPESQKKDNYAAKISLGISAVTKGYQATNIKSDLKNMATQLGSVNYKSWEVTTVASRTLLKKPGYYLNYRGVLYDGTIVRGRIHMALLDNNRLLTLQVSCPGWYNSDYMNVYVHIRNTLKTL